MIKSRPNLRPLRILSDDQLHAVTGGGSTAPRPTGQNATFGKTGRGSTELVSNPPTFSK